MKHNTMNPLQNIKDFKAKQAEQALIASRHDEKLQGFVAVAQTMQDSIQSLIKFLDGKTTKTEVVNQLQNLASPEDVDKVVKAVNALDDSVKAQSIDFEPVTAGLAKLEKQLADIPKELPSFEQKDELRITNLDEIDFTTLEKAFSDGISTIVKSIKAPVVNVEVPQVNVTTDVKDVVKPLKDLLTAFKGFKVDIPETDMSGIEKKLEQSNKYLKEISEKRFGGGGSGGGHSTPYQNSEGRATYVELLDGAVPVVSASYISTQNSSTTNLTSSNSYTFTGTAELTYHSDIMLTLYTDQDSLIRIQFSQDGTNWDSTLTKYGKSGFNEFTTAVKGARYIRVLVTTNSLTTTVFRLQTQFGTFRQGNVPIINSISEDADALVVRPTNTEVDVALGRFSDRTFVNKQGKNSDIDSGTLPEDVWEGGGAYTGFPTTSPELVRVTSSSALDTGTITFTGLKTSTSEATESETITMTGTTPAVSVNTWYRIHTASYNSGASTTFNVGTITVQWNVTTSVVFLVMQPGTSQTNAMVYTVPAKHTAILMSEYAAIRGGNNTTLDGQLWTRSLGGSPRLRRPFTIQLAENWSPPSNYLAISAGTDFTPRITATTGNNIDVTYIMNMKLIRTSY